VPPEKEKMIEEALDCAIRFNGVMTTFAPPSSSAQKNGSHLTSVFIALSVGHHLGHL